MHTESHPLAGKTVMVTLTGHSQIDPGPHIYNVEDWWDKLTGKSWMYSDGNPAAIMYAFRAGKSSLPLDDNVVYGKIAHLGYLAHVSEILEAAS